MSELEEKYNLSLYENIDQLYNNDNCTIFLCKNKLTNEIAIKKVIDDTKDSTYNLLLHMSHPNIPKVHGVFKQDGKLIVIEEHINGKTLAEELEAKGCFDETQVKSWVLQLCDVLEFLHQQKPSIIHRDIKPQNIIVSNDGVIKLIDFDTARTYNKDSSKDTRHFGTVGYAPPEQLGYAQTDTRSDIYSIGVLMNELLCGKLPNEKLYSGDLKVIIKKCIKLDIEQRYKNIRLLKRDLRFNIAPLWKIIISIIVLMFVLLAICKPIWDSRYGYMSTGQKDDPAIVKNDTEIMTATSPLPSPNQELIPNPTQESNISVKANKADKPLLFKSNSTDYIILDGKSISDNVEQTMDVYMATDNFPVKFTIGRDHPNGTKASYLSNDIERNFMFDVTLEGAFEEFGGLEDSYNVQITAIDLNDDDIKEAVVSIGDMSVNLQTIIYKFTNSLEQPFVYVDAIEGQAYMEFKKGNIIVPIGSQGIYNEYKYDKGQLFRWSP